MSKKRTAPAAPPVSDSPDPGDLQVPELLPVVPQPAASPKPSPAKPAASSAASAATTPAGKQDPASPAPHPAEPPATPTPSDQPAGPGDPGAPAPAADDLQALIRQAVQEHEQKVRQEYEGQGGHVARLKASYERQLAELRATQSKADQARIQAALDMAEENPLQAVQILAETLDHYTQREQSQIQASQMTAWAHDTAERLGLDPGDPDVLKVIEAAGPLTQPNAAFNLMGELTQHALSQARAQVKDAQKQLDDFKAQISDTVKREVATMLAGSGALDVDTSDLPAAPPPDNPIANINSPSKLLRMGFGAMPPRRRDRGGQTTT